MPGNRLPLKVLEWEPEGTWRRGRPKERWRDGVRRSMTNHGLTEEDTRDRDRWWSLVLGEGKPLYSGRTLDEWEKLVGMSMIFYCTKPQKFERSPFWNCCTYRIKMMKPRSPSMAWPPH
jgi:hypothetical protein